MPAAAKAKNEADRLAALLALDLLESPPSTEFDVFPALASSVFSTPIAAISLVDDSRQWFKASVGLDVMQTPRDESFCAHAILQPTDILHVPDATKDPRFADNPLVTGAFGLRFYAGIAVTGPTGHPVGALCVIDRVPREATEAELVQLRLLAVGVGSTLRLHASILQARRQADADPLTGLLNRSGFDRLAQTALSRDALEHHPTNRGHPSDKDARQNKEPGHDPICLSDSTRSDHALLSRTLLQEAGDSASMVGLLLLDLDGFKAINELFGHAGGDTALREVARRLCDVTQAGDVVSRFDGDEFCILVPNIRDSADLLVLASRIHAALSAPIVIETQSVPVGTSIGIAAAARGGANCDGLVRRADLALTQAKRAGPGRTHHADAPGPAWALPGAGRTSLQDSLRHALVPRGREPFTIALQPIHEAGSARLTGFEALVRWPQPGGQTLQPDEFIPVAEATGLIVPLDRWVLDRACQVAAGWPGDLQISSNLSAANFFAGTLVETVRDTLARHRLDPGRLKLEITETVLLHDRARVRGIIAQLRDLGVGVILDDFGAGHASIGYLRDYPFDGLKIDRSFTAGVDRNPASRAFIRAIIRMCGAVGLETTAEGVETESQLAALREEGIDTVQGYFLGRPTTPEETASYVRDQTGAVGPRSPRQR